MGFQDEYRKRFFRGDLTGPAKNFEQSVAFDAADRDRNGPQPIGTSTGDGSGGIDLFERYSKTKILRALGYGIASAVFGALLGEFFGRGLLGLVSSGLIIAAWILLLGCPFMLISNIFKAGFLGVATVLSNGIFWRGLFIGIGTGTALAVTTASASGFWFGLVLGIGLYAAYKIIKRNNKQPED